MNKKTTALILIGFQNDYFSPNGILHEIIKESARRNNVFENTMRLIHSLQASPSLIISTPTVFNPNYQELSEAVGVLEMIKNAQAFKSGSEGAESIPDINKLGDRIIEIPGKQGFNAFTNTELHATLKNHHITDVVLAGAITPICIDSTGRTASEYGYKVSILSDCTCGRSNEEQDYYCENILPIYARVLDHKQLINKLGLC